MEGEEWSGSGGDVYTEVEAADAGVGSVEEPASGDGERDVDAETLRGTRGRWGSGRKGEAEEVGADGDVRLDCTFGYGGVGQMGAEAEGYVGWGGYCGGRGCCSERSDGLLERGEQVAGNGSAEGEGWLASGIGGGGAGEIAYRVGASMGSVPAAAGR